MSHLRTVADAYAEAVLFGMPPRARRVALHVLAVLAVVVTAIGAHALGEHLGSDPGRDLPILNPGGDLPLAESLPPVSGPARDRARGGAGPAGASLAPAAAAGTPGPLVTLTPPELIGRLVERDEATPTAPQLAAPQPVTPAAPRPPLEQPAATGVAAPSEPPTAAAPAAATARVETPPPAPLAPRARPLRLEVRSIARATDRKQGDRLAVTLTAVGDDPDAEHAAQVMTMQVALPPANRVPMREASSLRLQVSLAPGADGQAPAPSAAVALKVTVALSQAPVAEPTVARTEPGADDPSDTVSLWVPLEGPPSPSPPPPPASPGAPDRPETVEPPVDASPIEVPAPPTAEDGEPAADATVPVDLLVAVAAGDPPAPQTVELPAAEPGPRTPPETATITVGAVMGDAPPADAPAPATG